MSLKPLPLLNISVPSISKIIFLSLASLISLISTAGIAQTQTTQNTSPTRIVSLAPVLTEMMLELDEAQRIVGRTSYCRLPDEIATKSIEVGGYLDASVERISYLKPDLVVALKGEVGVINNLRKLRIRVEEFSNEHINEINSAFISLGKIFNKEPLANTILTRKTKAVFDLKDRLKKKFKKKPLALFLLGDGSGSARQSILYAAGENSFYAEILEMLGLDYVKTGSTTYPQLSIEGIHALGPDIIIIGGEKSLADKNFTEEMNLRLSKLAKQGLVRIYNDKILYPGINYDLIARSIAEGIESVSY